MPEEQPLVSIDVVPVKFDHALGRVVFGTGARQYEPFINVQALPGVLLWPAETIIDAAKRALSVKTGLDAGVLRHIGAFDGANRDPRGATISISLLSLQAPDAESPKVAWHSDFIQLPFDHESIMQRGLEHLSEILWKDIPATRILLGEEFSTAEVIQIGSPTPLTSNVGRWLKSSGLVEDTGTTRRASSSGRPATVWKWL